MLTAEPFIGLQLMCRVVLCLVITSLRLYSPDILSYNRFITHGLGLFCSLCQSCAASQQIWQDWRTYISHPAPHINITVYCLQGCRRCTCLRWYHPVPHNHEHADQHKHVPNPLHQQCRSTIATPVHDQALPVGTQLQTPHRSTCIQQTYINPAFISIWVVLAVCLQGVNISSHTASVCHFLMS